MLANHSHYCFHYNRRYNGVMQEQTHISLIICMLNCLFMNTSITEMELFEMSVNEEY